MNMGTGNGQLTVPPGFRFHPTDEELLYYYLRKKVSYEAIDLDVIREVDLNKLEPWDLKEKCRIGSGPQNEWYFFSHKDKKYPTGTRTNRATTAGFWKATGRDKAIHLSDSKRIGMRKTLVFYTGRAPHGHKTDWIMHEYRLDDNLDQIQEEGWVVCRVFKKKTNNRGGFQQENGNNNNNNNNNINEEDITSYGHMKASAGSSVPLLLLDHHHNHDHHHQQQALYHDHNNNYAFDASMHLPQLFNSDEPPNNSSALNPSSFVVPLNPIDLECSHNLLRLTSGPALVPTPPSHHHHHHHRPLINGGDWTFLDKLLNANSTTTTNLINPHHNTSHHHHQLNKCQPSSSNSDHVATASTQRLFPFQYLGCETDVLKFSK